MPHRLVVYFGTVLPLCVPSKRMVCIRGFIDWTRLGRQSAPKRRKKFRKMKVFLCRSATGPYAHVALAGVDNFDRVKLRERANHAVNV